MHEFWKIIQIILLSSVKFVAGPPFAYFNPQYDFGFYETVLYSVTGGMLGVLIFSYLSKPFFSAERWITGNLQRFLRKKQNFSTPVADAETPLEIHYDYIERDVRRKRIFTRRNRRVVKIWKKYGLTGIAIVTPVLLSIPIGTIIANSLEQNKKKILVYMFISILLWSLTMTGIFEFMHVKTVKEIKEHVCR